VEEITPELLVTAIGIGLVVSLIFSETLGLAAGGMVVPGYIAINLRDPLKLTVTILLGLAAWLVVKLLGNIMILYGRRRTVMIILVGFVLGWFVRSFLVFDIFGRTVVMSAIGFIIPGLVGLWIDRQGAVETVSTLLTSGVLVRLCLILIFGGEMYTWH
jgi:poly-gamma-glutamate biosynthesis protein PgsC/CapC